MLLVLIQCPNLKNFLLSWGKSPINQPTDQLTNQSTNWRTDQPSNKHTNQPFLLCYQNWYNENSNIVINPVRYCYKGTMHNGPCGFIESPMVVSYHQYTLSNQCYHWHHWFHPWPNHWFQHDIIAESLSIIPVSYHVHTVIICSVLCSAKSWLPSRPIHHMCAPKWAWKLAAEPSTKLLS